MMIKHDIDIDLRVPEIKDMAILEKWYGMQDCLGYATGFKKFSDVMQKFKEPVDPSILNFMIYNNKTNIPVGFINGCLRDVNGHSVLWISIFIIDPDYQNMGYGTHALYKLLNFVQSKYGTVACIAAVSTENKKGLSFWEKAGFSHDPELERSLHHIGTSHAAIMRKILKR
ncbi:MAG: GNAT family N-acetyltransferase [Clostridiaceae bacterium]|nr:GNAT family N-acetyltransferase [Clostridiaceae bacterium]